MPTREPQGMWPPDNPKEFLTARPSLIRSGMPADPPLIVRPNVFHVALCAEALGWTLERNTGYYANAFPWLLETDDETLYQRTLKDVQFQVFSALQWASLYTHLRAAIEPILQHPAHPLYTAVAAWWAEDGRSGTDVQGCIAISTVLHAGGCGIPDLPERWTSRERRGLVPRRAKAQTLHAYLLEHRAADSAKALANALDTSTTLPPPNRTRL